MPLHAALTEKREYWRRSGIHQRNPGLHARRRQPPKETLMKKTIVSLLGAATIVVTVAATDASAQWRGRGWGWGWGPGIAAGVVGGAIIAGAIIASRPPGYVVYEGYGQPVYAPGCYWASQPIYDAARPRRRLYRPAGASLPRLRGRPAWWRSARICRRPACRCPSRICRRPAWRRSGRILHAALPVIRSENRNLSG